MTEESGKTEPQPAPAPGPGSTAETAPEAPAPAPPPESSGADALDQARREAAEHRDRALRALAELENFRRRAEKERQDTAKYAIAVFARDVLAVADALRRGLDSVSAAERKATPTLESLAQGMEMTERELLAAFERHGIIKLEPKGQPFDPNLHQAMMEIEDANAAPGTVVQVMQAGYALNDRLLRPALVGVAKGGAATGAVKAKPVQAPIANEDLANPAPGEDAPHG